MVWAVQYMYVANCNNYFQQGQEEAIVNTLPYVHIKIVLSILKGKLDCFDAHSNA